MRRLLLILKMKLRRLDCRLFGHDYIWGAGPKICQICGHIEK
jgi:hypothetical protein